NKPLRPDRMAGCLHACLWAVSFAASWPSHAQPSSRSALIVTPLTGLVLSGPRGGPFSPTSFQYRVSASTGMIRYAITPPFWLTAEPRGGTADMNGTMITFTVNRRAATLPPGTYPLRVIFTNLSNGQGTSTRTASLTVNNPPASGEYLLDDKGGYLLD